MPFEPFTHCVSDIMKDMGATSAPGAYDMDAVEEAGGAAFVAEEVRLCVCVSVCKHAAVRRS